MRHALPLLVVLGSGSCTSPRGAGNKASDPTTVDEKANDETTAPPLAPEDGTPGASPWRADISEDIGLTNDEILRVAAHRDAGQSTLWAQTVDDKGEPAGPATRLGITNGSVDSLDAVVDGKSIFVGWKASLGESRGIEAVAAFDLGLEQVGKTQTLRLFDGAADEDNLQMVARPGRGSGAAVAALAGQKSCKGMFFDDEGMTDCTQLALDVLGPDGLVEHTSVGALEGGEPSLDDLIDTGKGIAASFHAWRGGALTEVMYLSYAGKIENPSACGYPPIDLAWARGGLLSICSDPDDEDAGECSANNPAGCGKMALGVVEGSKPGQNPTGETAITGWQYRCDGETPVVSVSWKHGRIDALRHQVAGPQAAPGDCPPRE